MLGWAIVERGTPGPDGLEGAVYEQLRAIAARQMQNERSGHTLTATALVNEAYLKPAPSGPAGEDRGRFFRAAAAAMRRVLIDHARRGGAAKRGSGCGMWRACWTWRSRSGRRM